jgi:hypothetical protein
MAVKHNTMIRIQADLRAQMRYSSDELKPVISTTSSSTLEDQKSITLGKRYEF